MVLGLRVLVRGFAVTAPRPPRAGAADPRTDQSKAARLDALAVRIAARLVEPVAQRVAELLREDGGGPRVLSAAEVAERLGRSRDWVYAHRSELGAVALGGGPRPRLGFPAERVAAYLASSAGSRAAEPEDRSAKPIRRRHRGAANGQGAEYLPIRGRSPA